MQAPNRPAVFEVVCSFSVVRWYLAVAGLRALLHGDRSSMRLMVYKSHAPLVLPISRPHGRTRWVRDSERSSHTIGNALYAAVHCPAGMKSVSEPR